MHRHSRRSLIKKSAAAAGAIAASRLLQGPFILAQPSPNSKLNTAVIGANGQGMASVGATAGENLVALVDVDDGRLASTMKSLEKNPNVKTANLKTFFDYRELFDKMAKEIDVVFVATPDHNHAPASLLAIAHGKHTFCEKPLTHDLYQARTIAAAAKKHKVMTQMGNQGHSGEGYRRLCEYIWAGAIGKPVETHTWIGMVNGGIGGRGPTKPVPANLHWDQWLGPSAQRDYHDGLHPATWRGWWDFGGGTIADWGCHQLDGVFWALKLSEAKSVTLELLDVNGGSDERTPVGSTVRWTFPARGDTPEIKVHLWEGNRAGPDGKNQVPNHPPIAAELEKQYNRQFDKSWGGGGTLYLGDKGIMYTANYGSGPRIVPEERTRRSPCRRPASRASRAAISATSSAPARTASPPAPTSPMPARSPSSC